MTPNKICLVLLLYLVVYVITGISGEVLLSKNE